MTNLEENIKKVLISVNVFSCDKCVVDRGTEEIMKFIRTEKLLKNDYAVGFGDACHDISRFVDEINQR